MEQLVAEWYEYKGYFVKRNVPVGKRPRGGYQGELDVVAFSPTKMRLIHIETSTDADSWAKREERYKRKFELGKKYIPEIFKGMNIPDQIEQIALLASASKQKHKTLGGGKIVLVSEFLENIFKELKSTSISKNAIPEHWPLLRLIQFIVTYKGKIIKVLNEK